MFSSFIRELLIPLLVFLVLRSLLRGFFSSFRRPAPRTAPQQGGTRLTLHKDPVCGVYVSADTSVAQTFGEETVYFCSPECRDKYRAK
jgi:YHS domain-containing protein